MKKKEQESLLKYLKKKRYKTSDKAYTPTKYCWRIGYNQALHDISLHISNQGIPKKEHAELGLNGNARRTEKVISLD